MILRVRECDMYEYDFHEYDIILTRQTHAMIMNTMSDVDEY